MLFVDSISPVLNSVFAAQVNLCFPGMTEMCIFCKSVKKKFELCTLQTKPKSMNSVCVAVCGCVFVFMCERVKNSSV